MQIDRTEIIEWMTNYIQTAIKVGFKSREEILATALEMGGNDVPASELQSTAERVLADALTVQLKEQNSWPATTDCDRLDAAFAELEEAGIVSRQNFSCCGSCAAGEIWDEISAERDKGREIIGCAHFDEQDAASVAMGYQIYLSYGSVLQGEKPSIDIGHRIVDVIRSHGLEVKWNGSRSHRIEVKMIWRRRWPESI